MYHQKPLLGELPDYSHPLTPTAAWIMNEGSGNKIFDIIRGNHGIFGAGAAAPSWVPEGIKFDGGDYINCGDSPSLNPDHITISAEIKTSSTGSEKQIFTKDRTETVTERVWQFRKTDTEKLQFIVFKTDVDVDWVIGNTSISDNNLHHVVGTWDGSYIKVYFDGILDCTPVAYSGSLQQGQPNDAFIGKGELTDPGYWNGLIESVYFYNYSLSSSQIWQLHVDPYCWLRQPFQAELMYVAPPIGAIMNQFQKANLGADLYDGVLIA